MPCDEHYFFVFALPESISGVIVAGESGRAFPSAVWEQRELLPELLPVMRYGMLVHRQPPDLYARSPRGQEKGGQALLHDNREWPAR
jgi:hypothetical protein